MFGDEINAAEAQLAEAAPPRLPSEPISFEDEQAQHKAQRERDERNRVEALSIVSDPDEGRGEALAFVSPSTVNRPAVDLTVGNSCTYAAISDALAAAQPGDRLLLEGGRIFTENILISSNITLEGGYNGCASGSTDATTIDGSANANRVIDISPGLNATLANLILINGNSATEGGAIRFAAGDGSGLLVLDNITLHDNTAQWGGGLWVGPNANVIGTNVEIYTNTATAYGGGLRLFGAQATFTDTNVYDNSANYGGGVYASRNSGVSSQLHLSSSADIYSNEATTSGGGLYLSESAVEILDCSDFANNRAASGGGTYLLTSTLTINGGCSEIQYNAATNDGGGVYAQGSTINIQDEAEIYANEAGTDGTGNGGGLYLDASDMWGDKAGIRYNEAASYGGGIYATNLSNVDMDLGSYPCVDTRCSRLSNNTATNNYGGGIYAVDSEVDLRNIFIEDNSAGLGGGIYVINSSLNLYNNLLAENDATSDIGDAIRLYTDANMVGNGNTIAYNNAAGASTGQAIAIFDAEMTLGCSIIWGHSTSISEGGTNTIEVIYSDIEGSATYPGSGNLNTDPLFVGAAIDDYHLTAASPVIDRCASFAGMTLDFENEARPIRQTSDTAPYDMGADEFSIPRVGINGGGCTYGTITQAAAVAADGATIQVASGIFYENVVVEGDKSLSIMGGYDSACTTPAIGSTVVNGSIGTRSVFAIDEATVILSELDLTGGNTAHGGGIGLINGAQVTLDNTQVHDNQASFGGGVYIDSGSALTLTVQSNIYNNTATTLGGGVRAYDGYFSSLETYSDIYNNSAPNGGGIAAENSFVYLDSSDLDHNQATAADGRGGAILLENGSTLTMTGGVYIYDQNQGHDGAGVYADASAVYMQHSSITFRDNIATNNGGALYLSNDSTLYATAGSIGSAGDTFANEAVLGAGIFALTSTVNFQGQIINNIATTGGGGIYAEASTINLTNVQVGGANAYEANQISGNGYGAGIFMSGDSQATLQNTIVTSNLLQSTGAGAGMYIEGNSAATLIDSQVEQHTASSPINGRGAGIYVSGGALTLDNSQVLSNTASLSGGGIRLYASTPTTLTLRNDSIIRNNESLTTDGGGIAAIGDSTIAIANATIMKNTAATDGGGISINGGTLDFTGGLSLRSNDAGDNGGGLAAINNANVNFDLQSYSLIYDNDASTGDGGAFYLSNNQPVNLNITGNSIYIYANAAGHHGGAAYVGSNANLATQGTVNFDRNWSNNGHGGAIYVDGGGTLVLDADGASIPTLWDNRAYTGNGGAIYATIGAVVRCNRAVFGKEGEGNLSSTGSGGSLYLEGSTLESNNCTYLDGQAALDGGAIAAYASTLTILADDTTCDLSLEKCSYFSGNTADSDGNITGYGGAIYSEDSHIDLQRTYLGSNAAVRGGALYHRGADAHAYIANTLIYSNTTSEEYGAGVRTSAGAYITVTHTTVANNIGGAGFSPSSSSAWVTNSIAWGNSDGGFVRTYVYTDTNIDQSGTVGINIDPEFIAAGAGEDYHLAPTSPGIDACSSGAGTDLDGVARPFGSAFDMGAYEYAAGIKFVPDRANNGLPGSTVQHVHTLTNSGGRTDTFTLTAASSQGWVVSMDTPTVTLESGQSATVTVTVHVPADAPGDTVDVTVTTATSSVDPALSATVADTTAVIESVQYIYLPLVIR